MLAVLHDDLIVIAQYGGYLPAPESRGVVAVRWNAEAEAFELAWFNPDVQMNGVTTISTASNLVYSSGVDPTGDVHFYGLRLTADERGAAGDVVVDVRVADAAEWYGSLDNGNNTVIGDDGSASWATFAGFVRITPRS